MSWREKGIIFTGSKDPRPEREVSPEWQRQLYESARRMEAEEAPELAAKKDAAATGQPVADEPEPMPQPAPDPPLL